MRLVLLWSCRVLEHTFGHYKNFLPKLHLLMVSLFKNLVTFGYLIPFLTNTTHTLQVTRTKLWKNLWINHVLKRNTIIVKSRGIWEKIDLLVNFFVFVVLFPMMRTSSVILLLLLLLEMDTKQKFPWIWWVCRRVNTKALCDLWWSYYNRVNYQ